MKSFTNEQIDFIKNSENYTRVLLGGRGHSKTAQLIEKLQIQNKQLQEKLDKINKIAKDIKEMIFKNYGLLDKYQIEIVEDNIKDIQEITQGNDNNEF